MFSTLISAQNINWNNFDERKMDTVMFHVMNSYFDNKTKGDFIVWSPVVQSEVMQSNYEWIKTHRHVRGLKESHNPKWPKPYGLPNDIKDKIIEENVNPYFTEGQKNTYYEGAISYSTFDYGEILVAIPKNKLKTYQEIANFAIKLWNGSPPHKAIMNANYKKNVIVGTITFYDKETQRVIISFVYIS